MKNGIDQTKICFSLNVFFLVDDTIKLVKEKDERKALANRWKTEPQC